MERSNRDLQDMAMLDDTGAYSLLAGVAKLSVFSGTVTEGFVERFIGR